jgi:hypothetical protein
VDADTGQIAVLGLTGNETDVGCQVGPLLDQTTGPVASFTGGGAYDRYAPFAGPDGVAASRSIRSTA